MLSKQPYPENKHPDCLIEEIWYIWSLIPEACRSIYTQCKHLLGLMYLVAVIIMNNNHYNYTCVFNASLSQMSYCFCSLQKGKLSSPTGSPSSTPVTTVSLAAAVCPVKPLILTASPSTMSSSVGVGVAPHLTISAVISGTGICMYTHDHYCVSEERGGWRRREGLHVCKFTVCYHSNSYSSESDS